MKKYRTSQIREESWRALYSFFWGNRLDCISQYLAIDGLTPVSIETTKFGILITCEIWFLPHGKTFEAKILLAHPNFSAIQDFTPEKLKTATIHHSELEGENRIWIKIG